MTGQGTQTDPYIPETLTEFVHACGGYSHYHPYIHLTHDLNAADDPEYTGELAAPITLSYAVVTAENKCRISGVTVRAVSFFNCVSGVSRIEDVIFENCVHIRTSTSAASIEGNYGRSGCGFHRCGIFMEIQCGDCGQLVGAALGMTDTTAVFTLKRTQPYTSSLVASDMSFTRSNVQFVGAAANGKLIAGRSAGTAVWNTAAVRFTDTHFYTDTVLLSDCAAYAHDSYVYLERSVIGETSGVTVQFTDGENCLAAADESVTLDCSGAWTAVTPDVLKSADKLAAAGWIPTISQCEQLADGFMEGEYLKSSGEEYIEIPYIPDESSRVCWSGQGTLGGAGRKFAVASSPSRNCQVIFYMDENQNYDTTGYPYNGDYTYDIRQDGTLYVNGNYLTTANRNVSGTVKNMTFFRLDIQGKVYFYESKLRYFKAYEDGVPAWDMVPCVRLSDDAAGMYDKLTGTFFGNDGGGKLTTSWRYGENWGHEAWTCRTGTNDGLPYAAGTMLAETIPPETDGLLKVGNSDVKRLYVGDTLAERIYLGNAVVYGN